jgi:glutaredoxin
LKKIAFILIISFGFYKWYASEHAGTASVVAVHHNDLIMYSLTTCGFCKQRAEDFRNENIRFIEYYIDQDPKRNNELTEKLAKAGFTPQNYGTPILDVHGVMLPNNPSMDKIKKILTNG